MPDPKLEEVFTLSSVPSYTFVRPQEYDRLLVALRTPGRGVVVEGPSGIGKTTAVTRALEELDLHQPVTKLSARSSHDATRIRSLPGQVGFGIVIIDDFHRLDRGTQNRLASFVKTVADRGLADSKCVLIGVNKTGEHLVALGHDLGARVEVVRLETNPNAKVKEVLTKGQDALRIQFSAVDEMVTEATGSFYLAQMLAYEACLASGVSEAGAATAVIDTSFRVIHDAVYSRQEARFKALARLFASGPRFRRAGRAPYLHILKWLAESPEWSVELDHAMVLHAEVRGSVGQIIDKGYLARFLEAHSELSPLVHYDVTSHIITVEDPQFAYYLRNINWTAFARYVGFVGIDFESRYDFALSFARAERPIARRLSELLSESELQVFYDEDEQYLIAAEDLERYLGPIYRSEARYVLCILGPDYPHRIWTKFESAQFRERMGRGEVIPIRLSTLTGGLFDEADRIGGFGLDTAKVIEPQLEKIATELIRKLAENRTSGQRNEGLTPALPPSAAPPDQRRSDEPASAPPGTSGTDE
jgi:hypothetical protein